MAKTTPKKSGTKVAVERQKAASAIFTKKEYIWIRDFGEILPPWVIRGIPAPEIITNFQMTAAQRKQFKTMSANIKKQAKALTQNIQRVATLAAKVEKNAAKVSNAKVAKK